jgi:hypothetical protein
MLTGLGRVATSWRRLLGALVVVLVLLLAGTSRALEPAASGPDSEQADSAQSAAPEAPAPPEVRTGTTSVEAPVPDRHPTAGSVANESDR